MDLENEGEISDFDDIVFGKSERKIKYRVLNAPSNNYRDQDSAPPSKKVKHFKITRNS